MVDPNTVRRSPAWPAIDPGDPVVEIGAGLGSLTLALAETGAEVTAVELDRHLLPVLDEVLADVEPAPGSSTPTPGGWTGATVLAGHRRWQLVANLPYNVATPLVLDVLDGVAASRSDARDGAARGRRAPGCAGPGTPAYGIPSVKVAYWATAEVVGRVGPSVFLPRPKVESVLVRIVRRPRTGHAADPGPAVRAGASRVRAAPQDAAPITRWPGRRR